MTKYSSPASALQRLGLKEVEIRVYLTLLEIGAQPASIIAKKSALKRGHTYNVLHELTQKGIVQEFTKDKVKYFSASSPQSFLTLLKNREDEMSMQKQLLLQVLPDLERIRNPFTLQPKVRLFQGIDGMKEIYEDTIRNSTAPLYAFGDFEHVFPKENDPELHQWMWDYCVRRAKKGIWYYGILAKSPTSDTAFQKRKAQKRKLKMLKGLDLWVEVNVYGNKVAITSSEKDMVGLIIEDKPIADSLRNLHQALWKVLPEYR